MCYPPVSMANPNKQRGTAWESTLKLELEGTGRSVRRTALTATKDEPDVIVDGPELLPVLAVKHYYPSKGGKKRRSLEYMAVPKDVFYKLYALDTQERYGLAIQAKARESISVRKMLSGIVGWVRNNT